MGKNIRRANTGDAEAVRAIYAPFVSEDATSFEVAVPDVLEMARRIEADRDRYPWLVFEHGEMVRGYAYASVHRHRPAYQWSVDVSIYVHRETHRCGIGRALYTALFGLLRRQGYVNAYAGITLPNPSSVGLHESLGFVPVGVYRQVGFKFGRWHDVAWLALRLRHDATSPADPLPTSEALQDPAIKTLMAACAGAVRPRAQAE